MPFTHEPRNWIAVWCLVSLLSGWYDMLYVCLRPHSLPGGRWHAPFFKPMAQWAALDNLYGARAWIKGDTVLLTKISISCFEVTLHLAYLCQLARLGALRSTLEGRRVTGRFASQIALCGLLAFVVQATKQMFYIGVQFNSKAFQEHTSSSLIWLMVSYASLVISACAATSFLKEIHAGLLDEHVTQPPPASTTEKPPTQDP